MKGLRILVFGGMALMLLTANNCKRGDTANGNDYQAQIEQIRFTKDSTFLFGDMSPLGNEYRKRFEGLYYFPVNDSFRVKGTIKEFAMKEPIQFPLSNGGRELWLKWGEVEFTLGGQKHKLVAFLSAEPTTPAQQRQLFIPFRDATTGSSSYGGGRYLDIPIPEEGQQQIELDFNLAYNPYCAYNASYSCPLPPAENKIPVAVEAGEQYKSMASN